MIRKWIVSRTFKGSDDHVFTLTCMISNGFDLDAVVIFKGKPLSECNAYVQLYENKNVTLKIKK